jgi:hypothetical protein
VDLSPRQIRENLAKVASQTISKEEVEQFRDLLTIKGSPNGGVGVTDDLKYNSKLLHKPFSFWQVIWQIAHNLSSQVRSSKQHSRFPDCTLGWIGCW